MATLLLAHGAGAAMDSAAMNDLARVLEERGIHVARFEFGYMAARRDGVRRPPPKAETLVGEYLAAVDAIGDDDLVIGGKSMGGRVATLVADELFDAGRIRGAVCFGYPFHPPGKPEQLRTAHLETLRAPLLIVQGTRDEFGSRDEVANYALSPSIEIEWLEDGDHGLRPRKSVSGFTYGDHVASAGDAVVRWLSSDRRSRIET
ncbi:alpha/beta fold hydrolase [soil metagenome]